MALNKPQKAVLEALNTMLRQDAQLGLSIHKDNQTQDHERGYEYLHGFIDDLFAVKAAELTHAESICRAFGKVHSYKYVDDPSFVTAMEKEMVAEAVPAEERNKATSFLPKILKELKSEKGVWAEKDAGFNPTLDEIRDVSKPAEMDNFTIIDVEGFNKPNVTWDKGNASPSRTPSDS